MFFVLPLRANAPRPAIPFVTLGLILVNFLVFLDELTQGGPQHIIDVWGLQPARLWGGGAVEGTGLPVWLTLWTSNYLHFSWGHLLGNMLMLWLFGCGVEYLCGSAYFFLFYTLCGLLSSLAAGLLGGQSTLAAAGASGAIAGVMGAFLLNFPRARVTSWVLVWLFYPFIIGLRNISAFWFIGFWLVQQAVLGAIALSMLEPGPFGVFAHLAGALSGIGLIFAMRLPGRALPRNHPLRTGRLSAPIFGDEGDAGGGQTPEQEAAERRAWERTTAPFDGSRVRRLLEQGDAHGARALCEEMLAQAEADANHHRILGYERLLREIDGVPRDPFR